LIIPGKKNRVGRRLGERRVMCGKKERANGEAAGVAKKKRRREAGSLYAKKSVRVAFFVNTGEALMPICERRGTALGQGAKPPAKARSEERRPGQQKSCGDG